MAAVQRVRLENALAPRWTPESHLPSKFSTFKEQNVTNEQMSPNIRPRSWRSDREPLRCRTPAAFPDFRTGSVIATDSLPVHAEIFAVPQIGIPCSEILHGLLSFMGAYFRAYF